MTPAKNSKSKLTGYYSRKSILDNKFARKINEQMWSKFGYGLEFSEIKKSSYDNSKNNINNISDLYNKSYVNRSQPILPSLPRKKYEHKK